MLYTLSERGRYPRATKHIKQVQQLITDLIERGHAYQTDTGVYFDIASFPQYGSLSGNTIEQLTAGKRVDVRAEKKHPADFAMWKTNDPDHLQQWESPWGRGYPGWHIECSAMSLKYLGSEIDIHTGGEDNRFPHHENEIAQSEGATGEAFVSLWMHNAFLSLKGAKLAKRSGEQITLDTLTEKGYSPLAFRLLVFGAHYRQKMEFSWEALDGTSEMLETLKQLVRRLREHNPTQPPTPSSSPLVRGRAKKVPPLDKGRLGGVKGQEEIIQRFGDALADDLNTPEALAVLMNYVRSANKALESETTTGRKCQQIWATLLEIDKVVGVFGPLLDEIEAETIPPAIKDLAQQREQARASNNFEQADRLRGQIEEQGYIVEDTAEGPRIIKRI